MKRDIKINRANISSEEIQKGKNFSELTKAYKAQSTSTPTKPFYKKGWFSGTVASVVLLTTAIIILNSINKEKESILNNNTLSVLSDTTQTKFINPPAPGIDVKKDRYFVNAGIGGKIIHHTGSEIEIPEHSFVKEDGTPVTGEVEIQYREFHDQIDIFFSGIPMEYDSAGIKYNFESAGMMEIYAYQNGEKLKIAPNKELNVSMTSYNPDAKFNLYYLDEEAKKWDYRGKDSIVNENEQDFTYQPSVLDNSDMINKNLFTEEKEAVKEQEQVVEVIKKDIKTIEKAKPTKPLKAQKNVQSFDIDVNKQEFPEIAEYQGTIFEVIDQINFDAKIYDIQWEDIVLKQNGTNLCIELTKGKQTKKIDVKPVLEGNDYTTAIKEFSKKFDSYSKKLTTRKEDEKKAEAELQARREAFEAAKTANEKRIEEQIKLNKEWRANQNATWGRKNFSSTSKNMEIARVFKINEFGAWNSDQPLPLAKKKIKVKGFECEQKNIKMQSVSVLEVSRNSVISIIHWEEICFDPKIKSIVIGVTNNNDIVYSDNLSTIDKGSKIKVTKLENNDVQKLKEIIKA
jgi:hypothetical protein